MNAERNAPENCSTTEGLDHVVPANEIIVGFDQPIWASRRHGPLCLIGAIMPTGDAGLH